jgi:myo-inositol-1-phosphate synthase
MHVDLGGYHIRDIEFTAAFDIDKEKVGKDLSEAIAAPPNNTIKFADVPNLGVTVERGMTHDGLGKYVSTIVKKAGLPIVGDDIKSQVGATIVHRSLARLFHDRGVKLMRTSQLNVGGNMDFYNMLERERLESKKISKTNAVTSIMGHDLPADDVHVGPSDYVPWLTDRKWAHIRLEGNSFGDVPLNAELKLEVWDSPNSAGIVIDAVRCCKLALNHGLSGQLDGPSSYLMKSPMNQRPDDEARELTEAFIGKHARKPGTDPKAGKGATKKAAAGK